MLQSQLFTETTKETPRDEKSLNAKLLIRAGFVHKEMAGVYSYLPLGLRVLRKIQNIIREEMESMGGQEILMTVFQPRDLWLKTDRWSKGIGKDMFKCKLNRSEVGLGPTHEEIVTRILKSYIRSWRDLPKFVFQIQTKFRKELRAKSGLLRGREFDMKDLYSFHESEKDFERYYEIIIKSYHKILERCDLRAILTEASGKGFTASTPHEFQVIAPAGEDTIFYCPGGDFSQNKEVAKLKAGDKCPICKRILIENKSIEVGNIFPLGTKYSKDLGAYFTDKDGKKKPIVMGCYGLGPSRIMGAVVEIHHDSKGILWPKEIAPFQVHLIQLQKNPKVKKKSKNLYNALLKTGTTVLFDDRDDKSPGEKFADADLIGIPWRMVISERTLEKDSVELKRRDREKTELVKIRELLSFLEKYVQ
ncbi:hypothetical protein KJA17_02410 [Patescibacteria group bacterium]|nr:hypothetical protein [Patescibacteria group bacterium]